MYNEVILEKGRTVELNGDSIAFVEDREGLAFVHLVDGSEYQTQEDYEEFLSMFEIAADFETLLQDMKYKAEFRKDIYNRLKKENPELAEFIK